MSHSVVYALRFYIYASSFSTVAYMAEWIIITMHCRFSIHHVLVFVYLFFSIDGVKTVEYDPYKKSSSSQYSRTYDHKNGDQRWSLLSD